MPTLAATRGGAVDVTTTLGASNSVIHSSVDLAKKAVRRPEHLVSAILTTSVCLHLLLVGFFGFGIPAQVIRPKRIQAEPPPPPIVENIRLEEPPPPKAHQEAVHDQPPPAPADLPAPAAAISAVPSTVNVAFGIRVVGPVHLVSDTADASGTALTAVPSEPTEVSGRSLLIPMLDYPPDALYRRLSGKVVVEFHTTARGDIADVRIRSSSGYDTLDRAALENLRLGRWVGDAGYFTKTYEFVLR